MLVCEAYKGSVVPYKLLFPISYNGLAYQNKGRVFNTNYDIEFNSNICQSKTLRVLSQYKFYYKKAYMQSTGAIISIKF